MEVRCDKCQARYRVDDARVGPLGLTMRCGKCQNTFKVTRAATAAPEPAAPGANPVAARPAPVQGTMVFAASGTAKAAPPPPPVKPAAPKPAAVPATTEEGAGRTMMFQTGNLKSAPPPKPKPQTQPEGGATLVFGGNAAAKPTPAPQTPKPPARDAGAASTMVFGGAQALAKSPKPAPAPVKTVPEMSAPAAPPPAAAPPEESASSAAQDAAAEPPQEAEPQIPAEPEAAAEAESSVEAEGAEPEPAREPGTFDKAPPKGLLIGVAAGLALLLVAGGSLVAYKRFAKRPPPPAAVETLSSAQADAEKDTLASIASAEGKAKDAIDVAGPRAVFPEAIATLARIEIQWADALTDQAERLLDKNADDPKALELQNQAKAKTRAAYDALLPAWKADQKSADLQLALADYYRTQRSSSNMNRFLKNLKDDPRVALIQGMALAQDDEGAERAIPRLKAALAQSPQSARVHFRLALAYAAMKDDANARSEAAQALKLSPQHERARALLEQLGPPSAAQ